MFRFNLKTWVCIACLATSLAAPAPEPVPLVLDIIDLAAISRMTPQQLEVLAEGLAAQEIMRTKRSSAQALTSVVSKASSGLQGKIGLLGQASAGATSLISAASSKHGHGDDHGYSYEPHEESKVDFWGLKKSILYTLFQAVKAITGGVTILKGQLIKGSGALATTLGKVIKVKGEAVSNIGKKIVTSAALSPPKKPHGTHAAVYGPPPVIHHEYAPSAYGVPTAPAHYSAPSGPTGYSSHKFAAHLDGHSKGKLNGAHAGFIFLTPVGEDGKHEAHHSIPEPVHTPLEPPQSFLHSAFSAIKNVFSSVAPSSAYEQHSYQSDDPHSEVIVDHPPPPPPQIPSFKPMTWGAVNSYGDPAIVDTYADYDPRHPRAPLDIHATKKSSFPKPQRLSQEKLQKITHNINKVLKMHQQSIGRSSEELPQFDGLEVYKQLLMKDQTFPLPTPVVTDDVISSADNQIIPDTLTTTTTTTIPVPEVLTSTETSRRKKEVKFILRGNRIVQV